ncbi:MAG TPA: LacI family DNA-binding transcriptional regulator [Bacteroidota bacterium]|nr:LacI family DNA-binding transcriptional regulator [Bacteroidota bacterium]
MAVTIYDIAREAQVGIGTVSRVFNNHPNVTAKTREKILAVAKRLNYHPHAYAQALARKRTNTIAAIIPFFTNYFFIEVLQGVQDKISAAGYDLILYGIDHPEQIDEYLRKSLQRGRVDGILFFSMKLPGSFVDKFKDHSKPVVLVDTFDDQFDSLAVENFQGATIATNHLISMGHKNIGMISANVNSVPSRERIAGFKDAITSAGLNLRPENVVVSKITKNDGFTREAGYQSMKEMLSAGGELPTAIFITSDIQAIGALSALRQAGLKVPQDVALVGFDDIELAEQFGLTTMRQPMHEIGELAVEKLIARMDNASGPPSHINFLPKLVVRATCGMNKMYSPVEDFVHAKD